MGVFGFLKRGAEPASSVAPAQLPEPPLPTPDEIANMLQEAQPDVHNDVHVDDLGHDAPEPAAPASPNASSAVQDLTPAPQTRQASTTPEHLDEVPSFSDDDIAAAAGTPETSAPAQTFASVAATPIAPTRAVAELPTLEPAFDLPELPETPTPRQRIDEELRSDLPVQVELHYVPIEGYRALRGDVDDLKKTTRKSTTQMRALLRSMDEQKEPSAQFAETLNDLQRALLRLDNVFVR